MYWQSDSKTDAIPVNGLSRVAISALIVATICAGRLSATNSGRLKRYKIENGRLGQPSGNMTHERG